MDPPRGAKRAKRSRTNGLCLHPILICLMVVIALAGGSLALTHPDDAAVLAKIGKAWLPLNFTGFWDAKDPCSSEIVNSKRPGEFVRSGKDPNPYNRYIVCDKTGHVLVLDFVSNFLGGELIPEIADLQRLVSLRLANNNFTGTIPLSWSSMALLERLDLSFNRLSGTVPPTFGNLTYMEVLDLSDQQAPGVFGGEIPSELGNLSRLNSLALNGLNLTGTIPSSLAECPNLRYLWVARNTLHGSIPPGLHLRLWSFTDNYLQGSVPLLLANLTTDSSTSPSGALKGNCFERNGTNWMYITDQKPAVDCVDFYASLPPFPSPQPPPPPASSPMAPSPATIGGAPPGGFKNTTSDNSTGSGDSKTNKGSIIGIVIGGTMGGICVAVVFIAIIFVCCCKSGSVAGSRPRASMSLGRRESSYMTMNGDKSPTRSGGEATADPISLWAVGSNPKLPYGPTIFSYQELRQATDEFAPGKVLGKGGFGAVYYGLLPSDGSSVAIKVLSANSSQGEKEFFAELSLISQLSHRNLVRLRGWCNEDDAPAVLVYEFFAGGSLDRHLFVSDDTKPSLSWVQRYRIITGVAQALNYMHEEWTEEVVHRDVKSSNILLDSNMNGYLGDFGLALSASHDVTHFPSTRPAFTFGYAPPEAFCTNRATPKWDIFSFGVVCLEVASGLKAFDPKRCTEEDSNTVSLWYYAWKMYNSGALLELTDPKLEGKYHQDEMTKLLSLGLLCISRKPEDRPNMRDAVRILQSPPSTPVPLPMMDPMADPTLPDNFDARSFLSSTTGKSSQRTPPSYGRSSRGSGSSDPSESIPSYVAPSSAFLTSG